MTSPIRLSPNFRLDEFTRSQVAARRGIGNTPSTRVVVNLKRVCEQLLEPLRDAVGELHISSGYRSVELNAAIGGSRTSQHCRGLAVDVVSPHLDALALCREVLQLQLPFDQLIYEGTWTHISIAAPETKRRAEVLTATFRNGKASYSSGLPDTLRAAA